MQLTPFVVFLVASAFVSVGSEATLAEGRRSNRSHGHKHHHHKHHGKKHVLVGSEHEARTLGATVANNTSTKALNTTTDTGVIQGRLHLNGPLPVGFNERFMQAVGHATGCDPNVVHVIKTVADESNEDTIILDFEAPREIVYEVEDQSANPKSKLTNGNLRPFLVADSDDAPPFSAIDLAHRAEDTPVKSDGIDVDTQMPYGELEPFGREDTGQELTEQSVTESNNMVDQLERAEVAEEKRSVFRALTRLRGAAITSFDGIARSQTGNIDEYNKVHKWRTTHPLAHLATEESDISKWAFPNDADF